MKTLKSLSPSKENLSPAGLSAKHHDPVPELLAFIKAAGLKLPSYIQKLLGQDQGSVIKIISTQANPKQYQSIQKLKVRLGDSEFQLKKLEEDFAQFKLNSRLQKQRQIKKWQQSYNHLKNTLQYSNEDSSIKLIKLRQNAQRQIQSLKQKHDAQLKQQNQKMTKTYQQKISSLKKLNQREIKQLKQKSQKILQSMKQRQELQIRQLKQSNQSQIRKLCLKHKEVLDSKQKQYESTYVAIQSQKKTQQKLHQKTKIQASQAKQKLYSQLYYERNLKKDLEQIIQKRQAQIKSLKLQIHELEVDITLQKQKSEKREKQLKQSFQKQILGIEQLHKQKIADLLDSHEKQLKKYQNSVQQINQWKQNKQILMMERYQQVQFKFDERPSRQEDLDMIQKLRSRLIRKQQEVRILNKQLKNCVLESQNKQETYNRIFTCNTMNKFQKKCLNKDRQEFKSKDSLCRKSQTTDIKFLLKVYNKHI